MDEANQPLLSSSNNHDQEKKHKGAASVFCADEEDIQPIKGVKDFFHNFYIESVKLWYLAGPAIFTAVCQYSLGALTQVFAGQVGTIELAAVSVENSVISGFAFGIMVI
ncbi:transporter [Lithospermum erythrorhizon]|uniref:Transporter n=1 Tax=Lithospermum erythrorhizon TaxID=34254 RepID=A0AAV3RNL3_LITER